MSIEKLKKLLYKYADKHEPALKEKEVERSVRFLQFEANTQKARKGTHVRVCVTMRVLPSHLSLTNSTIRETYVPTVYMPTVRIDPRCRTLQWLHRSHDVSTT